MSNKKKQKIVSNGVPKPKKQVLLCCNQHYVMGKKVPVPMVAWKIVDREGKEIKGFRCSKCQLTHTDEGRDEVALQSIIDKAMITKESPDLIPVYIDDFKQLLTEIL